MDKTLLFMMPIVPNDIVIEKEYELDELVPVYVEKIHQVFINILNNAIFSLDSEGLKKKMITIKTFKNEHFAVISIFNSGLPIPDKYLSQIFDPFFTTKDPDKGKGLGLSICYSIVEEHNGHITAENLEHGVKFTVELPLNK